MKIYTEIVNGKRRWKQKRYLSEMFDRYKRHETDAYYFFTKVLMDELGLLPGGLTSYIGVYNSSFSGYLIVGDKVNIFPFEDCSWVVKYGLFEKVVEDIEEIFEIIRLAWVYKV